MREAETECSFLSSYAHVLVCLAENPRARLREVAERVGVTERTASRLIRRLDEEGFVERRRRGRRNVYRVRARKPLGHPIESGCTLEDLLRPVLRREADLPSAAPGPKQANVSRSSKSKPSANGATPSAERTGSDPMEVKL